MLKNVLLIFFTRTQSQNAKELLDDYEFLPVTFFP